MAELLKFNFSTHKWSLIQTLDIPEAAASACLCRVGNTFFLHGGTTYPWGEYMSNKLHACDLNKSTWKKMPFVTEYNRVSDIPLPGYGQSICYYNYKLFIFTGAVSYFSDPVAHLHMFDLSTRKWQCLEPSGDIPEGRYKQEMVVYDNK